MLIFFSNTSDKKSLRTIAGEDEDSKTEYVHIPPNTQDWRDCNIEGSKKTKYIIGSYEKTYEPKGYVKYTKEYKNCIDFSLHDFTQTGITNKELKWDIKEDLSEGKIDYKYTEKEFKYNLDKNNYITLNNVKYVKAKKWNDNTYSSSSTIKYSGDGKLNGEYLKFLEIIKEDENTYNTHSNKNTAIFSINAYIYVEKFKGNVVITTKKEWKIIDDENSTRECESGLIEIKGKEHTITTECKNGKEIYKFDGKEINIYN